MGATQQGESVPAEPPLPTPVGKGRSGPIRSKLRKAIAEARAAQRMTTEDEVRALVAERYAAAADDAARRGDERAMMQAADKLLAVLDALPVRTPRGGPAGDGSGGGSVHELFTSPPALGDGANA